MKGGVFSPSRFFRFASVAFCLRIQSKSLPRAGRRIRAHGWPLGNPIGNEKWQTACPSSRTLAQYSTDRYAGGLYCRVRDGTGCFPAAMAVLPTSPTWMWYKRISFNSGRPGYGHPEYERYQRNHHRLLREALGLVGVGEHGVGAVDEHGVGDGHQIVQRAVRAPYHGYDA